MATTAAEVLNEYTRDWNIDTTPIDADAGIRYADFQNFPRCLAVFAQMDATQGASGQKLLRPLESLLGETALSSPCLPSIGINWTGTFLESWRRLASLARITADHLVDPSISPMHSQLGSYAEIVGLQDLVGSQIEVSDKSRSDRALAAVSDLARWLKMTDVQLADLLGYRRSYYNWLKGVQPYPATTLNLHEAHATVESLVDALDARGARMWLSQPTSVGTRVELLKTKTGRDELSRLSSHLLFPTKENIEWAPDFDLRHEPGSDPHMSGEDYFGEPIEIEEPPQQ